MNKKKIITFSQTKEYNYFFLCTKTKIAIYVELNCQDSIFADERGYLTIRALNNLIHIVLILYKIHALQNTLSLCLNRCILCQTQPSKGSHKSGPVLFPI